MNESGVSIETEAREGAAAAPGVIEAHGVGKVYEMGDGSVLEVLRDVELVLRRGESLAITGESGAGKSTLLQILGGLDVPSTGEIRVGGRSLAALPESERAGLRNEMIGFVFQFHHLLREFSALENVMMPLLISGVERQQAEHQAAELLGRVGLRPRTGHKPAQLSGGEQQRVAVARALANRPLVLLADEPSGNLDPDTSERLHDLLFEISDARSAAMVLVTHNRSLARRAARELRMEDGHLVEIADT